MRGLLPMLSKPTGSPPQTHRPGGFTGDDPAGDRPVDASERLVDRHEGEYEMVRSNNNGGQVLSVLVNAVLIAGVMAGMAAAVVPMVA